MKQTLSLCAIGVAMSVGAVSDAFAHGYMDFPKARQAICQEQGGFWWPKDGSNIPNEACRAAFLKSEHVQFIQRHEFAVNTAAYRNQAAVEANIPDGTLCGAGDSKKAGMNIPSEHWQKTVVTPDQNGNITIRYRATTPHNPSFWEFYLTKPGIDFKNKPLAWSDLERVQTHGNTPFYMAPDGKRYYEMTVEVPSQFDGDAILYSRWQRDDVVGEGFYNCSDITIDRSDVTTPQPDKWFAHGYFVKQGQNAVVGDTIWVRIFDDNGNELVQQQYSVTTDNQHQWQNDIASSLVESYGHLIQIGVKQQDDSIVFDPNQLASNQVFLSQLTYSFNLSVVSKPKNTPPTVHTPAPLILEEQTQQHLHVHAFDDEQANLSFVWTLPSELVFTGQGSTITVTAPSVSEDTTFNGRVSVSDGEFSKTVPLVIKVTNKSNPDEPPTDSKEEQWQANKVYTAGDKVLFKGKVYRAKWWVRGQSPDKSQAWEHVQSTGNEKPVWSADKAYQGGAIVLFEGEEYQARWWTRGETPGISQVWKKQ